ncbi:MAG: CidA/LrgA family protein, partial [Beijerinckiaceae bacterium]
MLQGFLVLMVCQLAGEGIVRALAWPVPGPVIGIALLFMWLVWRDRSPVVAIDRYVNQTAQGLMNHFGLL